MKRLLVALLVWFVSAGMTRADLHYETATVPSPAGPGASGGSFAKGPDGGIWLSWIEPAAEKGGHVLKFSAFDRSASRWAAPRTIAQGKGWSVDSADTPTLIVQPEGRMTAVWPAGTRALVSQSRNDGTTWSAPQPLTRESESVEFVSLRPLADGSVLAAWLDGRAKKTQGPQQLYSRIVGSSQPDTLVDASVCDCCPTALAAFPDGSALLAYRGRDAEGVRDIVTVRYVDGQWEKARDRSRDRWIIEGCPVNGPRLAVDGPRVVKTWFTAAYEQPCVLVASSSDAGSVYTRSMRADLGKPLGRPDALLLRDGSQLITWLEQGGTANGSETGGLHLRRFSAAGATQIPTRLAVIGDVRSAGHPRIALVKDFDDTPAQFVVAFMRAGESSRIETLLVTLPEAELLAEADSSCACAPKGEELVGYPVRGQVVGANAESGMLRVRHRAVPGLLRAGEAEFKVAANIIPAAKPGAEVLARIEQRDGVWTMFDVRLLGEPQPQR
ncbi:MAG TPA: hypothetical protein VHO24_02215 [Opitutaceae bacterium]|nr:hypothetical protein [Opitutaceae bacterium]